MAWLHKETELKFSRYLKLNTCLTISQRISANMVDGDKLAVTELQDWRNNLK